MTTFFNREPEIILPILIPTQGIQKDIIQEDSQKQRINT